MSEKSRSFARGAMLLAVTGMLAKVLGAVYRIPLTNILGIEGMGQYQLAFPFFALLLALTGGAVPLTLSRLISFKLSEGDEAGVRKIVASAFLLTAGAGTAVALLTIALAKPLAIAQSNENLTLCYAALAPAVLFVSLANVFKGWFLGHGDMTPSALGQLLEQAVKLAFGLTLATIFLRRGKTAGVFGALLGVTLSELVGLIFYGVWYAVSKQKGKGMRARGLGDSLREIQATMTPIMAGGLLFPAVAFADSLIIIRLLGLGGVNAADATAQFGLWSGTVNTLINMPVVISLSLAVAVVPAIGASLAVRDVVSVKEKTALAVKLSFLVGVPAFFGLFLFAQPVLRILYPTLNESSLALGAQLMRVMSVNVILLSQLEIFDAMLQGLDCAREVLINLITAAVVKLLLQLLLVPTIGIVGACLGSIAFYGIGWLMNGTLYRRMVGKNVFLFQNISKILACGVIMALSIWLTTFALQGAVRLTVGILVGVIVYASLIAAFKVLTPKEAASLPLGKHLKRFFAQKEKG